MATRKTGRKSAATRKAKRRADIEEAVKKVQEQKIKESYAPPPPKPKKHKSRKDKRIKAESSKVKVEKVRIKPEKTKQVEKKISRKKKKAEKKRQEQEQVASAEQIQQPEPERVQESDQEPLSSPEQWYMSEETAGYNIIQNYIDRMKYYPMEFRVIVGEFLQKLTEQFSAFEVAKALLQVEYNLDDILARAQDYKEAANEFCALIIDTLPNLDGATRERLNDVLESYS